MRDRPCIGMVNGRVSVGSNVLMAKMQQPFCWRRDDRKKDTKPALSPDAPASLKRELLVRGIISSATRWRPLTGGRTNLIWRLDRSDGSLVCKLFSSLSENPLYPNSPTAEFAALKALHIQKIAPEPVTLIDTDLGKVLIYRYIAGTQWRSRASEVAHLLARLHAQPSRFPRRHLGSGSAALICQTQNILRLSQTPDPGFPRPADGAIIAPVAIAVPIHNDVVASNIIVTQSGLRLIDWQCPALGDPCEDLASFLSPAMQYLYGQGPLGTSACAAFLSAYPSQEIVTRYRKLAWLFHWRSSAYCRWKIAQGDSDYIPALALELSALNQTRRDDHDAGQNDSDPDISGRR